MGRALLCQKVIQAALGLVLAGSAIGLCPPKWISYRDELCFYVPTGPALSWKEASVFCRDQKAELVTIKDYSKQMFLRDLTDGVRGPALQYWIGLARREAGGHLAWMDGSPISQSWYSNWLHGHPKEGHCVQLVGFYTGQWRDWDCRASNSFICEMPERDAFPGSVRKVRFRSHCYAFHFPSFREMRSWREAQSFCQESGENLATVRDEEENAFLSYAFLEDGWHMWIGLRFVAGWKWSDSSVPGYFRWHPQEAPSKALGQCAVLSFQPADEARHGTWKTRPCNARPPSEATGFICQHSYDFCGPPEPVHFPLPGGMGPHATVDVVFSLPTHSTCSLSLTGLHPSATPLRIRLESSATHVQGSIAAELGGRSVLKNLPHVPFSPGLNTWSFITSPEGIASFFNHQEHFRLSGARDVSFSHLRALRITGVAVANASLEYCLSSDLHFPGDRGLQLENALSRYLSNFTLGLWLRSSSTGSREMCLVSYALKWRPPEFALFLLSPSGLEFRIKGATMFRGPHSSLLDGAWHHVAVSVSSALGVLPFEVFVDGESWEPGYTEFTSFLQKGLPLGGALSVGHLEVNGRGTSFYVGDLSEVNLWDRALPEPSARQLAASRTKWKFPGNVVSWNQLVAKRAGPVPTSIPSEDPVAAFVWFGLLRLRRKHAVLCADPQHSRVYIEPVQESCRQRAFWGLQLNGRLRNVADPASCLLVSPDGTALSSGSNCSADAGSSFRLLPDQRLQSLSSGFCLFQEAISTRLYLGKCTLQALHFVLDRGVHCPHSRDWRARKDRCLLFMLDVALEWSQALKFCQRFHGGSLLTLHGPEDLIWLQEELQVSVWTGLYSTGRNQWRWADGTPFHQALQRFISSQGPYRAEICMLALTSGFLKAELCHRPHRWICQAPSRSGSYVTLPGKSFYGAFSADLSLSSLPLAKRQCTALGKGCNMVVSTAAGHRLALGARLASLEDPGTDPATAVHVRLACAPGYSGQDCQAMCPHCEPRLSCNPLTGLCDGLLFYREHPATYTSLKCLPLGDWVFAGGLCLSSERYRSQEEAEAACQGYLGAEVWKVPAGVSDAPRSGGESGGGLPWACWRPEDVELPSLQEKLLVSLQGSALPRRRASLQEATDACFLHKERCTGVLSLHGAYYTVAGTVLADSPGSGATLYVKSACSPGFCGDGCRERCSPCLSTRTYNPLTGRCDGQLSCVRRFSPSCLQGLVNSRCHPGWWFWGGHCYYVEEHGRKDWQGAEEACQAYGKDVALLSLGSAKEKAWIRDMVLTGSWAGLNDVDGDGSWTWAGGRAANLSSPWLAGTQLPTGECLEVRTPGEQDLAASPCSELKPWVCKGTWAPWSPCPSEPGWTPWNGSCYYWDPSSLSKWPTARQACRRFRKTELLSLTSSQEKEWVQSEFGGSFWTGLNDLKEESVFRWTTQEPLAQELAPSLQDDLANGGLKDCVWLDTATGLLRDANCKEKRPYLCKGSEATDWFDKQPGRGVAGDPSWRFPSAKSLKEAKQECLLERSVCSAVLQTGAGFYLLSSLSEIVSKPDSTLYALTICAEGFSGPHCRRALAAAPRPACDCSGTFQTTAKKVCGIPVQECVDDCLRTTTWRNCSLCLPVCTEASLRNLGPEELALITMVQFKVSHSLNLTAEDERDRGSSSKIVYDPRYP